MRIIYGYSNCTDKLYQKLVSERGVSTMVPDQKYHGLLIRGLAANGAEVRCYSGLPVNRAVTARKLIREKDEQEGGAHFHYITSLNLPAIRQLMILCGAFFGALREKKDSTTYAVCDFLNAATAMGISFACKLRRIRRIAIVTDIPDMFDTGRLHKAFRNFMLRRFDGYVFLTEQMNAVANPKGKPHIVLEGHVDSEAPLPSEQTPYEQSGGKKTVLYAGNLHGLYGVMLLVQGFLRAEIPDAELRLYGHGNCVDELKALSQRFPQIRYMGTLSNSEIVAEEQRASLLVNPRPTAPEYTKYSFPSKNMEYMVSGTPLLTTRLPGMPREYEPYVYLIQDETAEGIAEALQKVFSLPAAERRQKGADARAFVLRNKSNMIQAKKLLDFLEDSYPVR